MVSKPLNRRQVSQRRLRRACPQGPVRGEDAYNAYSPWVGGFYPPKTLDFCMSTVYKIHIPGRIFMNSFLKLLLSEIVSFF